MRNLHYTNLSLDVIRGATVEEMMQRYFTEEEVQFKCEWCEGCRSILSSFLESPPRVFILQLKRFCFFTNDKICDRVQPATVWSASSVISGHYTETGVQMTFQTPG
ncbi:ubiquitin carboxyl-terminal hydrolase 37-like isoform X2 [Takifugu flavidus]|uniref:ubiquitin carboxyl-terminal hydrolase 37-like isoform X2 n=1 Tax=Takifugu flavidus TaxID=433684 RepID=UPI002544ACC9|nr:ubiquitin carboxyl-terminal hydrolase 37-like isoform X2 [Takifugu flavidus]